MLLHHHSSPELLLVYNRTKVKGPRIKFHCIKKYIIYTDIKVLPHQGPILTPIKSLIKALSKVLEYITPYCSLHMLIYLWYPYEYEHNMDSEYHV
jgi:hypothetical protein